ncbi:uncharacterized protein [Onthophagus taurus]|uniref:uncharacterized protein n=1 Tax=Onthophagus taurus TaxID=166361 RepID=UPI000C200354|nr:uncharacterized protein LOC111427116 [Onthophagus taurus]
MASRFAFVLILGMIASGNASPTFNPASLFGNTIEEMRSMCNNQDVISCIKYRAMSFMENMFQKDTYRISDHVTINRNTYRSNEIEARSSSFDEKIENYMKSHDVTFDLPLVNSKITLEGRNLDEDELNLKLSFSNPNEVQARKSKLKKIFVPILVFILLKAMTIIPLVLGVLGLKAWNALQLSFFSFVVSVAMAVFQLCKKLASDHVAAPQISGHGAWDGYAARSMIVDNEEMNGQKMAYSAYQP